MTADAAKGNEVKILWICGLFGLLSIVAYGSIETTVSDRALAQSETRTPSSRAIPPAGAVGVDAPDDISRTAARSMPALAAESSAESNPATRDLAIYLQLHQTREVEVRQVSLPANMCSG